MGSTILAEIARALGVAPITINISQGFIRNGGDSLSSMLLQAYLRNIGVQVGIDEIFNKSISQLLQTTQVPTPPPTPIPTTRKRRRGSSLQTLPKRVLLESVLSARHPMTEMQLGFVRSTQKNPKRNVIQYYESYQPHEILAMREAWKAVIESEPIFRIAFSVTVADGWMEHQDGLVIKWEEVVVENESAFLEELTKPSKRKTADDGLGTSFKVVTLGGEGGHSTIIWRVHHALVDGYSRDLVLNKVRKYLKTKTTTPGAPFSRLARELQALQERQADSAAAFWTAQRQAHPLSVSHLLLPSPSCSSQNDGDDGSGGMVDEVVLGVDAGDIGLCCQKVGVTSAALFHAAWALTLSRFSDSRDVQFGTVLSGRSLPIAGIENTVGPTINTLPLSVDLAHHHTVADLLRSVFTSLLELTRFQWTTPAHGFTRDFPSAVNVQLQVPSLERSDVVPSQGHYLPVATDVPLVLDIATNGTIRLVFHVDVFTESQISGIAENLSNAVQLLRDSSLTVESCLEQLTSGRTREKLGRLGNWQAEMTRVSSDHDNLVSLFTSNGLSNPLGVAVQQGSASITYHELHVRSSTVARRISPFVRPGDVVCVHADRSINWIIAIYAVLKAGGVYCPFDESLPVGLRDDYFTIAKAKAFLASSVATKDACPSSCNLNFSVEELLADTKDRPEELIALSPADISDNAYLCFTSGSTGKPKGVMCRHESIVAFQHDFDVRLRTRPGWKVAQFMSPGFDGSIHEIFSTLSYGATLLLRESSNPFAHLKAADTAILTPSVATVLDVNEYPNLKLVYFVGEAVPQLVCDIWAANKTVFNMYGPTEATCGATIRRLQSGTPVSLGSPNPSTRLYILDSQQQLAPIGVIGEIYLAGVQVASGYIGRSEETACRFLHDSINPQFKEYMYKTGDRAYWNECGELSFLGRNDRQIKLRGFRIDLDDLELRMHRADPACTAVAVALHDNVLVAQVQPEDIDVSLFRESIKSHVAPYAIPQHIIAVKAFPMTPAGKLDYKAIAKYEGAVAYPTPKLACADIEDTISLALREVLGLSPDVIMDLDSTLGDLGMDSILHISLSYRLAYMLKRRVPAHMVLQSRNLRDLARRLVAIDESETVTTQSKLGEYGVSPIEQEWWSKYQYQGGSSSFSVTFASQLDNSVDKPRLISAWNRVLTRHRILSCRYYRTPAGVVMRRYSTSVPQVQQVETLDVGAHDRFDLLYDELICVNISPTHLFVIISHIIADLTTLSVLLREVTAIYSGETLLPVKQIYSESSWDAPAPERNLSFWSEYLADMPKPVFIVGNNKRRQTWDGTSHVCQILPETYVAMKAFSSTRRVTMHQLTIAAVALALHYDDDLVDIVIGAPYLNRNREEDQDVVGLFLEPLPIRIQYPQSQLQSPTAIPPDSFIKSVQNSSRIALSHALPWHQLLNHLSITPDFPNHPILDAMVTFHHHHEAPRLAIPGVEFLQTWQEGAKFKIMAEFTAGREDNLMLRLEYSTECFDKRDMVVLERRIGRALEGIVHVEEWESLRIHLAEDVGVEL